MAALSTLSAKDGAVHALNTKQTWPWCQDWRMYIICVAYVYQICSSSSSSSTSDFVRDWVTSCIGFQLQF